MIIRAIIILFFLFAGCLAKDTSNTITRRHFNFGHQLGYIYSQMEDAYFEEAGTWNFQTGFLTYYTSDMPLVRNEKWKKRTMFIIPLYFKYYPTDFLKLEFDITDLFIEFPYIDHRNMGGKSPRFLAKMRILEERNYLPAIAFTIGVKFSSAKPYTIWANDHNYDESNGLAGAGTGVADYLLLFTLSKNLGKFGFLTTRLGLAPLGSPVEYVRGSAQADEIPYGLSYKKQWNKWSGVLEISGMYNGLSSTELAHYSVARLQAVRLFKSGSLTLNFEHGLTRESDEWVAGFYQTFKFRLK